MRLRIVLSTVIVYWCGVAKGAPIDEILADLRSGNSQKVKSALIALETLNRDKAKSKEAIAALGAVLAREKNAEVRQMATEQANRLIPYAGSLSAPDTMEGFRALARDPSAPYAEREMAVRALMLVPVHEKAQVVSNVELFFELVPDGTLGERALEGLQKHAGSLTAHKLPAVTAKLKEQLETLPPGPERNRILRSAAMTTPLSREDRLKLLPSVVDIWLGSDPSSRTIAQQALLSGFGKGDLSTEQWAAIEAEARKGNTERARVAKLVPQLYSTVRPEGSLAKAANGLLSLTVLRDPGSTASDRLLLVQRLSAERFNESQRQETAAVVADALRFETDPKVRVWYGKLLTGTLKAPVDGEGRSSSVELLWKVVEDTASRKENRLAALELLTKDAYPDANAAQKTLARLHLLKEDPAIGPAVRIAPVRYGAVTQTVLGMLPRSSPVGPPPRRTLPPPIPRAEVQRPIPKPESEPKPSMPPAPKPKPKSVSEADPAPADLEKPALQSQAERQEILKVLRSETSTEKQRIAALERAAVVDLGPDGKRQVAMAALERFPDERGAEVLGAYRRAFTQGLFPSAGENFQPVYEGLMKLAEKQTAAFPQRLMAIQILGEVPHGKNTSANIRSRVLNLYSTPGMSEDVRVAGLRIAQNALAPKAPPPQPSALAARTPTEAEREAGERAALSAARALATTQPGDQGRPREPMVETSEDSPPPLRPLPVAKPVRVETPEQRLVRLLELYEDTETVRKVAAPDMRTFATGLGQDVAKGVRLRILNVLRQSNVFDADLEIALGALAAGLGSEDRELAEAAQSSLKTYTERGLLTKSAIARMGNLAGGPNGSQVQELAGALGVSFKKVTDTRYSATAEDRCTAVARRLATKR